MIQMVKALIVIRMTLLGNIVLQYYNISSCHLIIFISRHAGVYTPEEVVLLTRDKLIKLQALYVDQFKRLHHQLKDARRRYLQGSKKEKENGSECFSFFIGPCNSCSVNESI